MRVNVIRSYLNSDQCPPLSQPENGALTTKTESREKHRLRVTEYMCNHEYQLSGPKQRYCDPTSKIHDDGKVFLPNQWTGETPKCVRKGMYVY